MRILITSLAILYSLYASAVEFSSVLSSRITYVISDNHEVEITEYKKIVIHQKEGYEDAVFVEHYDKFSKVLSIDYVISDQNGKRVGKYKKNDALEVGFSASYSIDDSKMLIIRPNYGSYPFTVEYTCVKKLDGFLTLPPWYPQSQYHQSVVESSLTVSTPDPENLKTLEVNGLSAPTRQTTEGITSFTWQVKNLSPLEKSVFRRSIRDTQPGLWLTTNHFQYGGYGGSCRSWTDFGDWFYQINQSRGEIGPATKSKLDELKGQISDKRELITTVFEYLQSKTRYVSIQLGIGGFQAIEADKVDQNGYGDCKALTNYMREMLEYVAIPSNFVLVNAGYEKTHIYEAFPSNQFNHVFLAVPLENDTIWLECTNQTIPPNYLGKFTDGRPVLWIEEGASKLIRSPQYSAEENKTITEATFRFDNQGHAFCTVLRDKKGTHYSEIMLFAQLDQKETEKRNYDEFDFSDFEIKKYSRKDNRDLKVLSEEYEVQVYHLMKKAGNVSMIPLNLMNSSLSIPPRLDANNSLEIKRGFATEEEMYVHFPPEFAVSYIENTTYEIDNPMGKYRLDVVNEEDRIIIRRYFLIEEGVYESEHFLRFKDFINEINKIDNSKIILRSGT